MDTKYTILLKDDVKLLEEAVVRFGRIVTFEQLSSLLKDRYASAQSIRNRISFLLKSGWLVKIKKGFYIIITDLSSLSFNDISGIAVAQALNKDSYVSFENALQYHSMFDQMLNTVDAVTFKRARKYEMQNLKIRFFKIKFGLYFGFEKQRSDAGLVNIADREKALLDILYFRSGDSSLGLILEKMKEYKNDINFVRLKKYAVKFGVGIIRKTGFLLDLLEIDTADLQKSIFGKSGYDRLTKQSSKFNAKWRIYFDDKLIN
ncbi:MAG: hypothetical protein A3J83_03885 [Elusimicrobia bacterium RIFOXYA2_FULL_40_6]|nr:MAG: hypothetical protein A3J83_03885 [Elusimicrobia bacterium RIFOXYA2_FULL_40_6]